MGSTFGSTFRKGLSCDYANHCGNCLIPRASRPLASVILLGFYNTLEVKTSEEQDGPRASRVCVHQIFTIRQVLGHPFATQKPTTNVFLEIRPAFGYLFTAQLAFFKIFGRFSLLSITSTGTAIGVPLLGARTRMEHCWSVQL